VKFGLVGFPLGQIYSTVDRPASEAVPKIARAADDGGFDFVCAQDHILAPRAWATERNGTTWFDPFAVLSYVAAITTRVRLLTDVLILPYRTPFTVAKWAASLDVLSNGRVMIGVAAGYLEQEFHIVGAEFERRGDYTDEAIEAIKAAWTNEWIDVEGEFITAHDVSVSPSPIQQPRPPIWVGGNSMRALRRAVEHADGWTPFRGSPETLGEALRRARDEFGLDRPLDVAVPIRSGVYTEDKSSLDADSILRQAEALGKAGVTHCKIGFRGPTLDDYLRAMEQFSSKVIARA
jgi:probable F420-dependent oxidoreductase